MDWFDQVWLDLCDGGYQLERLMERKCFDRGPGARSFGGPDVSVRKSSCGSQIDNNSKRDHLLSANYRVLEQIKKMIYFTGNKMA